MNKIRILIADDQPVVCEGLKVILQLEEDFEVVGTCSNGREALESCRAFQPDIVLMDARMPVMDGITAAREINRLFPDSKVLMLTTFNERQLVVNSIQSGVSGFLLKDMQPDDVCRAIREVHAGGAVLHPEVTRIVMERAAWIRSELPTNEGDGNNLNQLTSREKEVLRLIGRGLSNAEIAAELFITEGTVKNHVSNLLAKCQLRDRTQLALLAQKKMT
ncbi:MAG: two component transcriptional regulator, LuxR family [Firmicutes bacterium]|nr:two component transcriptional regulator, LuxR family [Bacillota bacterium]